MTNQRLNYTSVSLSSDQNGAYKVRIRKEMFIVVKETITGLTIKTCDEAGNITNPGIHRRIKVSALMKPDTNFRSVTLICYFVWYLADKEDEAVALLRDKMDSETAEKLSTAQAMREAWLSRNK